MMDGTLQMTTSSIPLHENKSTEFEDEMSSEGIHTYSKRRTLMTTDISCCTPASVGSGSDKYSHRLFPKTEFSPSKDTTILKCPIDFRQFTVEVAAAARQARHLISEREMPDARPNCRTT
jgi:hypothetical protein